MSGEWSMTKKVSAFTGAILGVAAVIGLIVNTLAWAEDLAETKAKEAEQRMQGREEVIHSTQKATHDYDFYSIRESYAEAELIALEQDEQAGVQLTATQERKMRNLEQEVEDFKKAKEKALDELQDIEDSHAAE